MKNLTFRQVERILDLLEKEAKRIAEDPTETFSTEQLEEIFDTINIIRDKEVK